MFMQRVLTALALLPIVIGIVFFLPLPLFAAVLGSVTLIAAWEWAQLAGLSGTAKRGAFVGALAVMQWLLLAYAPPMEFWPSSTWPATTWADFFSELPLLCLALAALFWLLSPLLLAAYPRAGWWRNQVWLRLALGWLLLLSLWIGIISLRRLGYLHDALTGAWLIFWLLLMVWAADTGAYFAGKALGKHKLAPAVSPGKTWEGFAGGLLLASVVATIGMVYWPIDASQRLLFLAAALVTVLLSVCGDLIESLAKREAGVKDSGTLFPGHGGMLDRIDSLIAAAPVFALVVLVLELH